VALGLLGGCSMPQQIQQRSPAEVRAQIVRLLPPNTSDRKGWATDIYAAFAALAIEPTTQNLCATLAVTEQESGFTTNPVVPGLAKIARNEIYRRAEAHGIPQLIVRGALMFSSHNGKSYDEQLATVRTEQDLSRIYEEFIGSVPMGRRLLAGDNPVHTAGPMQVSVAFAEQYARVQPYPYPVTGSIRHEVFTRHGGMYFGIAHLLGYPASYPQPLYRFADFNAGWYASRNAAFQQAVSLASGIPIALDGDLVRYDANRGANPVGATEVAVRSLARSLDLSDSQIHRALQQGESAGFDQSTLYERVFTLAEQRESRPLPRAMVPRIHLASPKITRKLTTDWYASRVDQHYRRCMAKEAAG
jgi:transposase-like protein